MAGRNISRKLEVFLTGLNMHSSEITVREAAGRITPLHIAAQTGNLEIAAELLKAGSNINAVNETSGRTPLFEAVVHGNYKMTEYLLQSGADPNIGSPRDQAIISYKPEIAALLEKHGARGELIHEFHLDFSLLKSIYHSVKHQNKTVFELAERFRAEGVQPLRSGASWDWVMVQSALGLAHHYGLIDCDKPVEQGGIMTLESWPEEEWEFTDAVHCLAYLDARVNLLEFFGESVSLSARASHAGQPDKITEYSVLKGSVLQLNEHSSGFDDPFIYLPGDGECPVMGGIITVYDAETLKSNHPRSAAGRLSGVIELQISHEGKIQLCTGHLEVAFRRI